MNRHFAMLIDCPKKGQLMMFPNYYESIKDYIHQTYDEVAIEDPSIYLTLAENFRNEPIKFFKKRAKINK